MYRVNMFKNKTKQNKRHPNPKENMFGILQNKAYKKQALFTA